MSNVHCATSAIKTSVTNEVHLKSFKLHFWFFNFGFDDRHFIEIIFNAHQCDVSVP